jgi:hypothetical protein
MTVLFEPASAIAASICIAARTLSSVARHPRPCGWCDWPVAELRGMVDGFNAWAGYDERRGTYRQFDAAAFQGLPRVEQRRLVLEAQAFPDQAEPAQAPPAPPPDADPLPAFLRQERA